MRLLSSIPATLLATALALPLAGAATEDSISETARALAREANLLPPSARDAVRQRALMLTLLAGHGRLLPGGLDRAGLEAAEVVFLAENTDPAKLAAEAGKLAAADELAFDGKRLVGGNFRNIDPLIGVSGLPIAFDRQLPAFLVPLSNDAAEYLRTTAATFHEGADGAEIGARTDRIYRAAIGSSLVADGLVVRPYAGRIDDLYFYLTQEGERRNPIDFYAITDCLGARSYHPLVGLVGREAAPPPQFNLSDLLTGGGLGAVEKFRSGHPGVLARNPFGSFAARVVPFLGDALRSAVAGSELKVSRDVMKQVINAPRRFAPAAVPPLFPDCSRFLGVLTKRFIPVGRRAKSSEFSEEIASVEAETPLPDESADPAANEMLADATPEAVAPDPPPFDVDLLGENTSGALAAASPKDAPPPAAQPEPPARVAEAVAEPVAAEPVAEPIAEPAVVATSAESSPPAPEPTPAPAIARQPGFQLAVLMPTAAESEAYLKQIAEGDEKLSANAAQLNRTACYLRWLDEASAEIETAISKGAIDPAARERLAQVLLSTKSEIDRLRTQDERLRAERLAELTVRGDLRRTLEQKVRAERGAQLQLLTGANA